LLASSGDDVDSTISGKLGIGRDSGICSGVSSGTGVAISVGDISGAAVVLGATARGRVCGPGLIGRTASKYCVSAGDRVSVGVTVVAGTVVSLGEGTTVALSGGGGLADEIGVSVGETVGEAPAPLCFFRGVEVGVG
jgi:hypothetical protein